MNRDPKVNIHTGYRTRLLITTVVTLVGMLALVRFWPMPDAEEQQEALFQRPTESVVQIEMIEPTRQVRRQPPPSRPLPPIPVPDEVVIEEEPLELDDLLVIDTGDDDARLEGADAGNTGPTFVARADQAPKPVKFVEPEYSKEARKERIKAQIVVEVRVDEQGGVQESRILDRFLIRGNDAPPEPVSRLGYGVEEAVLAAAGRWRFVPARHNGRVVQSLATLEFTIGR